MIITRTPFRLSLFGGGLDYPEWFSENPSWILTAAINRYSYISIRRLPPFFDHKSRIVYSKVELVKNNKEIIHPGVKGCLNYLGIDDGLEIHYDGDLPARSGIGSSSSFTVGLLKALSSYNLDEYVIFLFVANNGRAEKLPSFLYYQRQVISQRVLS